MTDNHRAAAFYNTCVRRPVVQEVHRRHVTRFESESFSSKVERQSQMDRITGDDLMCESVHSNDVIASEKSVFNMADFYESIPGKKQVSYFVVKKL